MRSSCGALLSLVFVFTVAAAEQPGAPPALPLWVGGATTSITPDQPVALSGQFHTRISRQVDSPCTATALALESRRGDEVVDQAIMVSCDLVSIGEGILPAVRERISNRLKGFDPQKLFLSATHTHTGPVMVDGLYELPAEGVMPVTQYRDFLVTALADVAVQAWESRAPGRVGWGLGHAVVAQNRRAVYANGTAQMYGATNRADFRGIEGYEDHGVHVLCFWDAQEQLIATVINIACPSQEVEGKSTVDADFWHPVREALRARFGEQLLVLGWTGAAGDQSPHLMYEKPAEERMRRLRGLSPLDELARRIIQAWDEAYEGARQEIQTEVPLIHKVETLQLPVRQVTEAEYADAQAQVTALARDPQNRRRMEWQQATVDRYLQQREGQASATYPMELHVLRLGEVAIATNSFELFTDFGIQIKSRSPAVQTFVVQLTGPGTYLPTERAVRGGGYSAIVQSSVVGPEGGQVLVDATVQQIASLWSTQP
jgi:hypothetical protein